jgi:Ca2+-binding EF-hand superfamily protein
MEWEGQQIEGRVERFDLWDSGGLQFHKFIPCTGNPSHRFSSSEDFSLLFET